jgi:hypothetical protein
MVVASQQPRVLTTSQIQSNDLANDSDISKVLVAISIGGCQCDATQVLEKPKPVSKTIKRSAMLIRT